MRLNNYGFFMEIIDWDRSTIRRPLTKENWSAINLEGLTPTRMIKIIHHGGYLFSVWKGPASQRIYIRDYTYESKAYNATILEWEKIWEKTKSKAFFYRHNKKF